MFKEKNYELWQGDCREILKNIGDNSIDVVITDIPYGIDFSSWDTLHNNTNSALGGGSKHQLKDTTFKRRGKPLNGWSQADKNIPYEYEEWCKSWSNELLRITKPASPILIFSSRRLQHRVSNALEDSGFVIRDVLIWEKNRCNAKAQRINNVLNKRNIIDSKYNNYRIGNLAPYYEPIIFAMKPYKGTITDCVLENNVGGFYCENDKIPSNIFKIDVNKRNKYHETEKPIELMEKLISVFSMENQVILDFTMGGGSTGVAAMNLHRKFIGIELDPQYFEIAQKRIQDIVL
jgi:site-specific DNA-methyltransferase (adenine-specific)